MPPAALNAGSGALSLCCRSPIMGTGQPLKGGLDVNRQTTFGSPYLLGFEHLERLLERTARTAGDSYPPYNIEELPGDGGGPGELAASASPWQLPAFQKKSLGSPRRTAS